MVFFPHLTCHFAIVYTESGPLNGDEWETGRCLNFREIKLYENGFERQVRLRERNKEREREREKERERERVRGREGERKRESDRHV